MVGRPEIEAVRFRLGDRVRIKDLPRQLGRITELRGPLGPGGALIYRVRLSNRSWAPYIELLGDQMEVLTPDGLVPEPAPQGKLGPGNSAGDEATREG